MATDSELDAYFSHCVQAFETAASLHAKSQMDFSLACASVHVRIAGKGLQTLQRPLTHLPPIELASAFKHEHHAPALKIMAWDGSTGGALPAPPWQADEAWYLGEITGVSSDRFWVNVHPPSGLLCMLDKVSQQAIYWIPNPRDLPYWELAAPFRTIFHWWACATGGHLAHAAAVGCEGQGVLIVGRGGSGKSTLAVACLDAGMQFAGDDYLWLTKDPRPRAYSLYNSAKIHRDFLASALPHWQSRKAGEIGPHCKALFFLIESLPQAIAAHLTIRAVVIPHIGQTARLTHAPNGSMDGLLALAPSTIYQLPGARHSALPYFTQWMEGLPVYRLETSSDLTAGPAVLTALLKDLEAGCAA